MIFRFWYSQMTAYYVKKTDGSRMPEHILVIVSNWLTRALDYLTHYNHDVLKKTTGKILENECIVILDTC